MLHAVAQGRAIARSALLQKLRRLGAANRNSNQFTRGIMTTPPTVTARDGTTTSGLTNSYVMGATEGADLFRAFGGDRSALSSGRYQLPAVTVITGANCSGTNTTGTNLATAWAVEAMVDSVNFDIIVAGSATAYFVVIDGQYVSLSGHVTTTASGVQFINFDFTSAGGRAIRNVRVEGESALAFKGINVGPTETVFRSDGSDIINAAIVGDSITQGVGASFKTFGYANVMSRALGWKNVRYLGSPGTGWLATSSGAGFTARGRIADLTRLSPAVDIACHFLGINDTGSSAAAVTAEVTIYLQALRAALPSAIIPVFGSFPGSFGPGTSVIATENAIFAAVTAMGDPSIFSVPISTDSNGPWVSGTGKVGTTTGIGNSDVYTTSDGIHPPDAGHKYYGLRAADALFQKLAALT